MSSELAKSVLERSRLIQDEVNKFWLPPVECPPSRDEMVLPNSLVKGTRGYIILVVNQINATYKSACYDACAVMVRRLVETLLIEAFEQNNIARKIKNEKDEFLPLSELVTSALNENSWNLGRNTVKALKSLPKLKGIGDLSAHNRRYNAHRGDIDKIITDLRTTVQELLYLAKFK